ncbi:MAG: hypothetical protein J6S56_03375 [Bacteroidales bacterium]|nr:hypothetical protein [Bacteroidales bacterium]
MKKILLFCLMVVAAGVSYGQYYGLLGKRVIFNLEGTTSPAYFHKNYITEALENRYGEDKSAGMLSLNFFVTPSVEVAVWKKGTVGAGYNFFTSPFEGMQHNLYSRSSATDQYVYEDYGSFDGHVTAHGFNLYYKQYVGNADAPLGHYLKFNLDCFFSKYVMDGSPVYERDPDGNLLMDPETGKPIVHMAGGLPDYTIDSVPANQHLIYYWPTGEFDPEHPYALSEIRSGKSVLLGFKLEYGYDFWPTSFMKLSLGVSLGSTFGGYRGIIMKHDAFTEWSKRTFKGYADGRILGAYWLQFKLGIGFCAF